MANDHGFSAVKWLTALVAAGAVAGGVWYWLQRGNDAPDYQTVSVTRGEITQVVTATGTLNPVVNVQVGSQISGIIKKLHADFNSPVSSNQVVAELDSSTYQASVHSAEGELANTRAGLELAQVDANRATELVKSKLISQSDYDKAVASLHQAEAQVRIREASLERAKVDLSRCTIYAPVDGIVISRNVDVGQTVAASLSAPTLFVIANDLTKMQIDANVAEADVGNVEVGQEVEFTVDAFPYRTFRGQVKQVRNAPITLQNVVTYDTVIEVSNSDLRLKPGMTANVSIVVQRREGVLRIANAALRFRPPDATPGTNAPSLATAQSPRPEGGGFGGPGGRRGGRGAGGGGPGTAGTRPRGERQPTRTVYLLPGKDAQRGDAKLKPVQIRTGISDGIATEVVEGLNEGDVVVTGSSSPAGTALPAARPTNPFGGPGGGGRGFGRF